MVKTLAVVFGVVFVLIGILGFVPGVTTDGMLLGLFKVNTLHNIIHLVSGAAALYAGLTDAKTSKMYFQVFGVVYALVAVLGFVYGENPILGIVSSNMYDTYLHIVIALVALYAGFVAKAEA
jgi:hypothetical protein